MLVQVGVPAVVALLVSLTGTLAIGDGVDRIQCFDQIYSECNETTDAPLVNVSISGRPNTEVDVNHFSQVLAGLVCHHFNTSTLPSLCVYVTVWSNSSQTPNSTLSEVGVLEVLSEGAVRPALSYDEFVTLIQSSQSFFALAGFHVNITEGSTSNTSGSDLFSVPLSSWICVGIGLFLSLILLAKPVWWDRMIKKCWHKQ